MRQVTRALGWIGLVLVLTAPTIAHGLIIKSRTAQFYWVVRQDHFDNLPHRTEAARWRYIASIRDHGPFGIGTPIWPKPTASYWIVPGCPGRNMKPEFARLIGGGASEEVLECRR